MTPAIVSPLLARWLLDHARTLVAQPSLMGVPNVPPKRCWAVLDRDAEAWGIYGGTPADTIHLLPDGRVFSRRALTKIRRQETGWRYAVEQLVAAGADAPSEDLDAWLSNALAQVTRRVRHPGNFKYAVPLTRCARKALPASLPYPRVSRAALDACPTIEGGSCVSPGV